MPAVFTGMHRPTLRAFGLDLQPGFPLPGLHPGAPDAGDPVSVRLVSRADTARRWSEQGAKDLWSTEIDGCPVSVQRSRGGEHRIVYGDRADFWLSADKSELLCAPAQPRRAEWRRFLLDTVLTVTSLLRGFEALHASAVLHQGALVALIANTGGGKTSLAAELVRRGATLFCDDILVLRRQLAAVAAYPGPALMNVPLSESALPGARTLARLGDEAWIALDHMPPERATPTVAVLLERTAAARDRVTELPPSPLPLLPHALGIATERQRARTRFEVFADLAAGVRILRLEAHAETAPAALADLVEGALKGSPPALAQVEA